MDRNIIFRCVLGHSGFTCEYFQRSSSFVLTLATWRKLSAVSLLGCFGHSLRSLSTGWSGLAGARSQLRTWSGLWSWERIKCEAGDLRGADPPVTPRKLPLLSALILIRGALMRLLVNITRAQHRHLAADGRLNYYYTNGFSSRSSSAW